MYEASDRQRIQRDAISAAYGRLADSDREIIYRLAKRLSDGMKQTGPISAIEIIGAVGIKLEQAGAEGEEDI